MNTYNTYTDPNYQAIRQYFVQNRYSMPPEEYQRIKNYLAMSKGNITRRNRLEMGGVDTEELLAPMKEAEQPGGLAWVANTLKPAGRMAMSSLGAAFKLADTGRDAVVRNALLPALGLEPQLGGKAEIYGSDILRAMGMSDNIGTSILGFGLDVISDPLTYITAGVSGAAKTVGGKILSRQGMKAAAEMGVKATGKAGYEALTAGRDMFAEIIRNTPDFAAKNAKYFDKGGLKFAGKTIIPGTVFDKGANVLSDVFRQIERIPVVDSISQSIIRPAGRWLGRSFVYGYGKTSEEMEVFENIYNGINFNVGKSLKEIVDRDSKVPFPYIKKGDSRYKDFKEEIGFLLNKDRNNLTDFDIESIGAKFNIPKDDAKSLFKASIIGFKQFDVLKDELVKNDLINEFITNYTSHAMEVRNVSRSQYANKNMRGGVTSGDIGKHRIVPTERELRGIVKEFGLEDEIRFLSATESDALKMISAHEAIGRHKLVQSLIEHGIAKEAPVHKSLIAKYKIQDIPTMKKYITGNYETKIKEFSKSRDALNERLAGAIALEKSTKNIGTIKGQITRLDDKINKLKSQHKYVRGLQDEIAVKQIYNTQLPKSAYVESNAIADERALKLFGIERVSFNGKDYHIPTEVAQEVHDMTTKGFFGQRELGVIANLYDSFTNQWKRLVTIPFPSFHGRNIPGDAWRGVLHSMIGMLNPKIYKNSMSAMLLRPEKLANMIFDSGVGIKHSLPQLIENFQAEGLFRYDIGQADLQRNINSLMKLRNPADIPNRYIDMMERFGTFSENHMRFVHFLIGVDKGLTYREAAAETRKFHYDYQALTQFEKKVMRRIIPFYSWTKKNTAFMLRSMYERPGKMMAHMRAEEMLGHNLTEEERSTMPGYMREMLTIPLFATTGGDRSILGNLDLPIDDLNELGIGLGGWKALAKTFGGRLNPILKYPAELITRRDFFYGTPLSEKVIDLQTGKVEYPQNKAYEYLADIPGIREFLKIKEVKLKSGAIRYELDPLRKKYLEIILGGGIGSRPISEINKVAQIFKGDWKMGLLNFLTGAKIYPINIDYQKKRKMLDKIRQENFLLGEAGQ